MVPASDIRGTVSWNVGQQRLLAYIVQCHADMGARMARAVRQMGWAWYCLDVHVCGGIRVPLRDQRGSSVYEAYLS